MSTFEPTEFDTWLQSMVRQHGEFTVLIILAKIGDRSVEPLVSTFLHVIGNEANWADVAGLLSGSGRAWDGAAFFPTKGPDGGPIDNATARSRLTELQAKVMEDRMTFNDGHFFDTLGRRIEIEPIAGARGT